MMITQPPLPAPPPRGGTAEPDPLADSPYHDQRAACFRSIGFSEIEADILASGTAQIHEAHRLIHTMGCSLDLALKILS